MNSQANVAPDQVSGLLQPVPFYRHGLRRQDGGKIAEVLATPFITSGQVGREVEDQLCAYFDVAGAKLTNSWTNGAVAVLLALGVGPGDEVIVPAMTFVATANVVELVGATPVFVDVDPNTFLMELKAVRAAITARTKAIIPVHLYGQMVDMAELRCLAGPDIALIEDCAHAFESRLRGERPGHHSNAAIFSFYATKNVTCGEGGAIVSNDETLMDTIRQTILHGMSAGADRRFEGALYRHWGMERLGVKANLTDILAALLPDQIATVDERRDIREALVGHYRAAFDGLSAVTVVADTPGGVSAHHLFAIGVPRGMRDRVLHDLNKVGIGTTVNYRAVHTMGFYTRKYRIPAERLPVAFDWGERTLSLPLFPGLEEQEQARVIEAVVSLLEGISIQGDRATT